MIMPFNLLTNVFIFSTIVFVEFKSLTSSSLTGSKLKANSGFFVRNCNATIRLSAFILVDNGIPFSSTSEF